MTKRMLTTLALSASLAASTVSPALADGAASTRNILIGGAAAALLIINHNKKVHERYAEDSRRQAQAQADADNARSAYVSERRAYENEAALVGQYKREVAVQHSEIVSLRRQVAMAQSQAHAQHVALAPARPAAAPAAAAAAPAPRALRVASVSYGWGQL